MSTEKMNKEFDKKLETRFNEPGQVNSVDSLYRYFAKEIPKTYIANYLNNNPHYQISRKMFKSKDTQSFTVNDAGYVQVDLMSTRSMYPEHDSIKEYQYLMNCIVLFTRKVFCYPIKDKTVEETSKALRELKKDYPLLKVVQTDRGTEFKWKDTLLKELGIKHILSSPYNPTSQSFVERMNGVIKNSMMKYLQKSGINPLDKPEIVEQIIDSINDQPNKTTGVIPNQALTKENIIKLKESNDEKTKKRAEGEKDDILEKGTIVRVALHKTDLTTKERTKIRFSKLWTPNFTTQVYKIKKVYVSKNFKATRYKVEAIHKNENNPDIEKKFFFRRDLLVLPKDFDITNEFKPKVNLIRKDKELEKLNEKKVLGRPKKMPELKSRSERLKVLYDLLRENKTMLEITKYERHKNKTATRHLKEYVSKGKLKTEGKLNFDDNEQLDDVIVQAMNLFLEGFYHIATEFKKLPAATKDTSQDKKFNKAIELHIKNYREDYNYYNE